MKQIQNYAFQTVTEMGFEETIEKVTELLQVEGFGVLTEIDLKATLKKKIDIDYKPYKILGACNPNFAHKALNAEPYVGVLLPCNVIIWDDGDRRVVAALEPKIMAEVIDNPALKTISNEVSERLHRVLTRIEEIGR